MATLIGTTWRHKKRGTTYRVVLVAELHIELCFDDQECFIWMHTGLTRRWLTLSPQRPEPSATAVVTMMLPVTVQKEPNTQYGQVVIYQSLADNSLWARAKKEFIDGRFERVEA